jgi:DNA-binding MarR family transcriptional regulator
MTVTDPVAADPSPSGAAAPGAADDVPWLTTEQQGWWRAYLTGSARLTEALSRQLDRDSDLSLSEYEVLVRLSEAPGRTRRMAELAESLVHSRSRLTHAVTRMERRGLVERRACQADGRGINATLTDAGMAVLVAAAPGHVRAVREHLVSRLTDAQLRSLGEAMALVAPDAGRA